MTDSPRYQVHWKARAEKDAAALPAAERRRVADCASALAIDPRPRGTAKIKGRGDGDLFRIRVGQDYRLLYTVDDEGRRVVIARVRHRREAYR